MSRPVSSPVDRLQPLACNPKPAPLSLHAVRPGLPSIAADASAPPAEALAAVRGAARARGRSDVERRTAVQHEEETKGRSHACFL